MPGFIHVRHQGFRESTSDRPRKQLLLPIDPAGGFHAGESGCALSCRPRLVNDVRPIDDGVSHPWNDPDRFAGDRARDVGVTGADTETHLF